MELVSMRVFYSNNNLFNDRNVISSIYLVEQVIDLVSAVKELHGLNSQELYRLLRDAENFTVHHLTGKGLLLKVVAQHDDDTVVFIRLFFLILFVYRLIWTSWQVLFHCTLLQQ